MKIVQMVNVVWVNNNYRLINAPFARLSDHRFKSIPKQCDCDDWKSGEDSLSPGDTWAVRTWADYI